MKNYIDRNKKNIRHINGCCNVTEKFEWEDSNFVKIMAGDLPEIRNTSVEKSRDKISMLSQIYSNYDFFSTDSKDFLERVNKVVADIRKEENYWSGLSLLKLEEVLNQHKFCLISGDGGIGKSYFVKCLEEELSKRKIKHLCLYGKIEKDVLDIEFSEMCEIGMQETFVFVFDAINEIDEYNQTILAEKLKELKKLKEYELL